MKPNKIILHHSLTKDSGTVSWQAIRKYHCIDLGWSDIGYHYGIEKVNDRYEILLGRMLSIQGAHTKEANKNSIGICMVGNFDDTQVSFAQWLLCLKLVKDLLITFNIPCNAVYGHNEFNPGKTCPGRYWDMQAFRKDLLR